MRLAWPDHTLRWVDREAEHLSIKEKDRARRLVLRRGTDVLLVSLVRKKSSDLGRTELRRMLFTMEDHEPTGPASVCVLRPPTELPGPASLSNLFQ
jgi:hypothetical protein